MLIWVVAILLVGGFALIGHQTGSIRCGIGFLGVALGLALAPLLGGLIRPGLAGMGVKDQIALEMLPGVFAFLIVAAIFFGIGVAAHRPVEHHFKYRTDEPTRQAFERMNQALGLFVGLLSGICVLFTLGSYVHHNGYLAVQTTGETGEAAPVRYVAQLRQEMETTGWARTFAAVDKSTPKYYDVSDILGILHANPLVQGRAENYPPFFALAEMPEFADIGADKDYQELVKGRPALSAVLNNPKTLTILNNASIRESLGAIDLKDLRQYLETGVSPKYDDEKILGRWRIDSGSIFTAIKRQRLNTSPAEIKRLREALVPIFGNATFIAYTDGRFSLKFAPPAAAPAETPAETPAAEADPNAVRNSYLARYGVRGGTQPAPAPAPARKAPPANTAPAAIPTIDSFDGTWVRADGRYLLTGDMKGEKVSLEAMVNDSGRLTWTFGSGDKKVPMFFVKTT